MSLFYSQIEQGLLEKEAGVTIVYNNTTFKMKTKFSSFKEAEKFSNFISQNSDYVKLILDSK